MLSNIKKKSCSHAEPLTWFVVSLVGISNTDQLHCACMANSRIQLVTRYTEVNIRIQHY